MNGAHICQQTSGGSREKLYFPRSHPVKWVSPYFHTSKSCYILTIVSPRRITSMKPAQVGRYEFPITNPLVLVLLPEPLRATSPHFIRIPPILKTAIIFFH